MKTRGPVIVFVLTISTGLCIAQDCRPEIPSLRPEARPEDASTNTIDLSTDVRQSDILRLVSAPPTSIVLIGEKAISDPVVLKALSRSSATLCVKTTDPIQSHATLSTRVSGMETVVSLPTTPDSIRLTYPSRFVVDAPSEAETNRMINQIAKADSMFESARRLHREVGNAADKVRDLVQTRSDRVLIIVSHNDGEILRFHDGSTLALSEFYELVHTSQRKSILLSCETIRAGAEGGDSLRTARRLGIEEVACVLEALQARVASNSELLLRDVVIQLNESFDRCESGTRTVALASTVGAAVIVALVVVDHDD